MESTEKVIQQFTKALESGNASTIASLIAHDVEHNLDRAGITTGLGTSSALADASNRVHGSKVKILDTIINGDQVVVRFQFNVNGEDVKGAVPGSNATVSALCVARVQGGKVVSAKIEQDVAGLYLQLGLGIADAKY